MEALRIKALSKQFGGVEAVNDVSFTVNVGERLAITFLLRAIIGQGSV